MISTRLLAYTFLIRPIYLGTCAWSIGQSRSQASWICLFGSEVDNTACPLLQDFLHAGSKAEWQLKIAFKYSALACLRMLADSWLRLGLQSNTLHSSSIIIIPLSELQTSGRQVQQLLCFVK